MLREFLRDEDGANLFEYLLMAVFLGAAIAWAIGVRLKQNTGEVVDAIGRKLKE
jgi:Flp pilus assembly pilin Flp